MNKIPIRQVVIVEGKYDKITLENIIDATIIPCDGFGIFKNDQKKNALREMAKRDGVIILTDSDRAGGRIRAYLQTILQGAEIYLLYTPAVAGKERRKVIASKDGYLGVEGIDAETLRGLFKDFSAEPIGTEIQAVDLFEYGFSGSPGAAERKRQLILRLQLPLNISQKGLLKELNRRFDREGFLTLVNEIKK